MRAAIACRSATADHRRLVPRVADTLLELPAVRIRLAPLDLLQLRLRVLELLARPFVVDVARLDGVVDQREGTIALDLEEPRPRRELQHVLALPVAVDACRAGLQQGH